MFGVLQDEPLGSVQALASLGCTVIMAGRSLARLEAAAADIRAALLTKVDLQCMLLDVGSLQSIKEFVAQFTMRRLPLHFLINNAGAWRE